MWERFLKPLLRLGKSVGEDVNDRVSKLSRLGEKKKFTVQYELDDTDLNEFDDDDDIKSLKLNLYEFVYEDKIDNFKSCIDKIIRILKRNREEDLYENEYAALERIINTIDENRDPILSTVVSWNNLEAVKLLIQYGADVNIKDGIGTVPLHYAAWGTNITRHSINNGAENAENKLSIDAEELKNEEVIDYLRLCNADPNIQDSADETPLHNAAIRGNSAAVRALLRFDNIIVNISNAELKTPLHIACSFGWLNVCNLLTNANACVTIKDKKGYTPLHYAATQGNCSVIELLLQNFDNDQERKKFVKTITRDYETPLTLAITNERTDAVKLLIEKGACVTSKHKNSATTQHIASSTGNIDIMQILLDNDADINWINDDEETPLHVACVWNQVGAVDFLLSHNADLNATDSHCRTPFFKCFENKPSADGDKIIELLVKHGANTKAVDQVDKTVIMSAAKMNNVTGLKYLLNMKTGKEMVNFIDRRNNSALHYAAKAGNLEAFKCLTENGALLHAKNNNEETPFHLAVEFGYIDIVKYILEQDVSSTSLTEADNRFDTPLHTAAKKGNCDMVKLLLSHSSGMLLNSLEKQNSLLYTALDYAAVNGHKDVVEILLRNGAKLDAGGYSPLREACEKGNVSIVKFLLNKGASIDRLDAKHRNCLEVAIDNNQQEVAKAIVNDKRWKDVMKHSRDGSKCFPQCRSTPLRELIKIMPGLLVSDVARLILDKCVTENGGISKTYDYELLDDVYSNWSSDYSALTPKGREKQRMKQNGFTEDGRLKCDAKLYSAKIGEVKNNHPLMIMVSQKNENLLGHEIVYRLLERKWRSYIQYIHNIGVILYILFIAALTDFAVSSTAPYNFNETFFKLPSDFCHKKTLTTFYADAIPSVKTHTRISQYLTLTLSIINLVKEMLQAYFRQRDYLQPQNLLEICLYICSLLFVVDWNHCSAIYGYRVPDQWLFGVAAAILAWMNLILMIRQFPTIGIYVVMFTDVLRTFTKFFIIFFLFIMAFALAFFMLLQNQAPFATFPKTLVKTLVMMQGEFDYTGIFYFSPNDGENINYPEASQTVFFLFALIMAIIIMNLLTGLAVDDIKSVQNKALLNQLAMKVQLVLEIEYIAPDFIRRKFMVGKETVALPEEESLVMKLFHVIFPKSKSESVVDAASELFADDEEAERKRQQQSDGITKLQKSVEELKSQQVKLESMLSAIAIHLNVPVARELPRRLEPGSQLARRW